VASTDLRAVVDSVAVLPHYQKQGVGRMLLQRAVDQARSSGLAIGLVAPPGKPLSRITDSAYSCAESSPFVEKLGLQQTGNLIASRDDNRFQVSQPRRMGALPNAFLSSFLWRCELECQAMVGWRKQCSCLRRPLYRFLYAFSEF
jgi:GNAT superfamily N-acetyltransferase